MKSCYLIMLILSTVVFAAAGEFDKYFTGQTMRIDYVHVGDNDEEWVAIDHIYKEGEWAGTRKNMIDPHNNGKYFIKVYEVKSGNLIFSRGFNSYFGEYQTTAKAINGIKRAYHESAVIPFPIDSILFTLEVRDKYNKLNPVFSSVIDPNSVDIIEEKPDPEIVVVRQVINGTPQDKVDLAFIGEGYTKSELDSFKAHLAYFTNVFLNQEPFKTYKDRFNIYGVLKYSAESGIDEPTHHSFKNTAVGASFNSMGSPRYVLTEENKALHDIASAVPYDALLIMINHDRYGGGGIYNFFLTFTTGNIWKEYVMVHEFGHSFAGLADEYYSSSTAYEEFYPPGVEPVEPNITALLDPQNLKWQGLVEEGTPIPTPWNKEAYDKAGEAYNKKRAEYNKKIAELKKNGAPEKTIKAIEEEANLHSKKNQALRDSLMTASPYWGKTGAFEGAGYISTGFYRPQIDCIMFSQGIKDYCPVCRQAIVEMIKYYTE
ncbi:MAG: peptidase M64 [Calditrichaceae bacterium]|nr:peptidase M64 [Calditrichaceae bacterium]MBN2707631.1 peptidase M64 [Calditrichaceae bacterium]RQV93199.1 MAG: peptidase M64 [Calditrichota bacterium]